MTVSRAILTLETAPRDIDALATERPWIHRRLGSALEQHGIKVWESPAVETAFVQASDRTRAELIYKKLLEYDAVRGVSAPAAVAAAAPAQAPVVEAALVPAVEAVTPPPRRAPKARAAAPAAVEAPALEQAATQALAVGTISPQTIQQILDRLKSIETRQKEEADYTTALTNHTGLVEQEILALKSSVGSMMKLQQVQIGLMSLVLQDIRGASLEDFLPEAVDVSNEALDILHGIREEGNE